MLRAPRRPTADSGVALFVALTYFNASTFGFHVIVSRLLGPARYGALGAILVLASLSANATGAIHAAVTRTVAAGGPDHDSATRRVCRLGLLAAVGALALVAVLTPVLEGYLHLGSPVPVLLFGVLAAATVAGMVPRGVLMGRGRLAQVATSLAVGVTVKVVAGTALAAMAGVSGAMAGAVVGEVLTTVLYFAALGPQRGTSRELVVPLRSFSLATGAYWGFWLLVAADTFLARHLLSATSSGLYVAASTAGSIALFLPNNITLTAFPGLAGAADPERGSPDVFGRALLAAGGLTALAVASLSLAPGLVVAILFGPGFRAASAVLVLLAVSNGAQGMVSFLLHHQLAHHRATCLLPWVGLAALAVVADVAHRSATQVAVEAMTVSLVLLAVMTLVSLRVAARTVAPTAPLGPGFVKD